MMPEGLDRLRNARILVVEDSIANQTLARDLLLHAGAHVDLAGNGKEAIAAIENADEPYDAVLMDLQMPIMDGLEATGVIRGRLALDKLPISHRQPA
jgi:CheY-like chemotaxis protein